MFKPNKYTRWYNAIVSNPDQTGYTETHHIVPRSLNGDNNIENLVAISARQHFICHWLLTKMTEGQERKKMINALVIMQGQSTYQKRYATKITSRAFAHLREEYAQYISERNSGRIQPPEENAKQKAAQTGRKREPFSEEWLANIKAARQGEKNGMFNKKHSDATKSLQRAKAIGRKYSAEVNASKGRPGLKREKLLCPHCNREVAVNGYARWHGENCRKHK